MKNIPAGWIKTRISGKDFADFLASSLLDLCSVNTTPESDLAKVAESENKVFRKIEEIIEKNGLKGTLKKHPFLKRIKEHPFYTNPSYTDKEWPYDNRGNLVYEWAPEKLDENENDNPGIAVNAHIDTVPPFIPPYKKDNYVFGRGACDDKGGCITLIGALKLLKEINEKFDVLPESRFICMFVTDEEIGGNGSLSLALDDTLQGKYKTITVYEPSDSQIHPGNRGALWYKIDLDYSNHSKSLILALNVIMELEKAGTKIREESIHPLFDKEVAQTCHGIFGPYGKHPSTICDEIGFSVNTALNEDALKEMLLKGLSRYTKKYGDKTLEKDKLTGRKKVDHHFDIRKPNGNYELYIWGKSGHMGSVAQNDNAITKAAYMLTEVFKADPLLELDLIKGSSLKVLTLEGGQGFLPTHTMEEIKERFAGALKQAWEDTKSFANIENAPQISFAKLHNEAFAGSANSESVRDLVAVSKILGSKVREPLRGFPVSCDARIFAKIFPELEVITTGPGSIKDAHSNGEKVDIREVALNSAALALFVLKHSGAAGIVNAQVAGDSIKG